MSSQQINSIQSAEIIEPKTEELEEVNETYKNETLEILKPTLPSLEAPQHQPIEVVVSPDSLVGSNGSMNDSTSFLREYESLKVVFYGIDMLLNH